MAASRDTAVLVGVVALGGAGLVLASQLGGNGARRGVPPGGRVELGLLSFEYRGAAQPLWINWGLKRSESTVQRLLPLAGVDFDNGQGLVAGHFASGGPLAAPASRDWTVVRLDARSLAQRAVLRLERGFFPPAQYDAWVWLSRSPTPQERDILQLFLSEAAVRVGEG